MHTQTHTATSATEILMTINNYLFCYFISRSSDLSDLWVKLMQKRWIIEMPCIRAGLYAKLLNKILEKHSNLSERETITNLLLIILCPYNSKALDELVSLSFIIAPAATWPYKGDQPSIYLSRTDKDDMII